MRSESWKEIWRLYHFILQMKNLRLTLPAKDLQGLTTGRSWLQGPCASHCLFLLTWDLQLRAERQRASLGNKGGGVPFAFYYFNEPGKRTASLRMKKGSSTHSGTHSSFDKMDIECPWYDKHCSRNSEYDSKWSKPEKFLLSWRL